MKLNQGITSTPLLVLDNVFMNITSLYSVMAQVKLK